MNSNDSLWGKNFGVLGDSYSTFRGWIPEGNACFYPNPDKVSDVLKVEDTWWHLLMQRHNMNLCTNESYSGAIVCETPRDSYPMDSSFTKRAIRSFGPDTKEKAELIFVFGCTNDYWFGREMGEVRFADWDCQALKQTLPAVCYILHCLRQANPGSRLVLIINDVLPCDYADALLQAAKHYEAVAVELKDIAKQNGHPTAGGMRQIADQIDAALK